MKYLFSTNLEYEKEFNDLLLDELNVKKRVYTMDTHEGKVIVEYERSTRRFNVNPEGYKKLTE